MDDRESKRTSISVPWPSRSLSIVPLCPATSLDPLSNTKRRLLNLGVQTRGASSERASIRASQTLDSELGLVSRLSDLEAMESVTNTPVRPASNALELSREIVTSRLVRSVCAHSPVFQNSTRKCEAGQATRARARGRRCAARRARGGAAASRAAASGGGAVAVAAARARCPG